MLTGKVYCRHYECSLEYTPTPALGHPRAAGFGLHRTPPLGHSLTARHPGFHTLRNSNASVNLSTTSHCPTNPFFLSPAPAGSNERRTKLPF